MNIHFATDPLDDFMADPDDHADDSTPHVESVELPHPDRVDPLAQPAANQPPHPVAEEPLPSTRGFWRYSFALLASLLLLAIGFGSWRVYALEDQRDALERRLQSEVGAHRQALLLARDAEERLARYIRDNEMRRQSGDERLGSQEQRAAELKQQAEQVRLQQLANADCRTPRSILRAAGL